MFPGLSALGSEPWAMSHELLWICAVKVWANNTFCRIILLVPDEFVVPSSFGGGMDHLCHAVSSMPFSHSMEWRDSHMAICVCMSVHRILCAHIYNALPEIHDVRLAGVSMSSMNGFQGNHNTILSFSRPSMWIQGGWHPCMEFSQFIYTLYFCYKFAYSQTFFLRVHFHNKQ